MAELLLKENKRIYIKDLSDDIYFADIVLVGEDSILIDCFAPEKRKGERKKLYWIMIVKMDEYKEVGE